MAKRTPLYDSHVALDGKIVEFAGFELPVQYETGIMTEHTAVRTHAGIFDVSHMGEIEIAGEKATEAVCRLFTSDIAAARVGETRYGMLLNENGGVVDDLLIYRLAESRYLLVVNASNTDKDFAHVQKYLVAGATARNLSDMVGQLALQGPFAERVLKKLTKETALPARNEFINFEFKIGKTPAFKSHISRTGYTGEDGFEIYCPAANTPALFAALLEAGKPDGLIPCGLGCRDTLRLECAYPLYGHELREDYLASETGLAFALKSPHNYLGKEALAANAAQFARKGVRITDKGIAREGCVVYEAGGTRPVGVVTSGTHSPTLGYPVAMLRVEKAVAASCQKFEIDVRGRRIAAEVASMPFYKKA